ncbi:internal protein D [Bordetella phage vB_BbrP_BB8]|uniref:Internal protein D n=1 Tax=Bordetella phage vB_BbrP_BB8 TaxID=2587820 RepID=A0A4Y5TNT7_9CAUD|nr:internal protein D [Bordetella phage vB_BbrP_BB8]
MEDNVKKFLDFLGKAEGADYDTIVGGKQKITDFASHPNIVGLRTADGPSTAAGKYQITKTTYDDFAPKLGITDFSPESQDKLALAIIEREGALDAIRRGDWNTAIGKLGGRWASLPSSPYKQPKRTAEFVQQHLGVTQETPEANFGMNAPGSALPTEGPSQAGLEIAEAQRQSKYGGFVNQGSALPTAIQYGFQNENTVYNFFVDQGLSKFDPNFVWDEETAQKALEGIPRDNRDYILQAGSWDEVLARRGRVQEALKRQQELSQMGFVGTMGTLTGALVDLPTAVGFLPVVGGTALVSRSSRVVNALASGLAGAAGNVAVDAAMLKYRPTGDTDELYFSALAGLGFGALSGGLIDPVKHAARVAAAKAAADMRRAAGEMADIIAQGAEQYRGRSPLESELLRIQQYGSREASRIQAKELEDAGLVLTENGKRILGGRGLGESEIDAIRSEWRGAKVEDIPRSVPRFEREFPAGQIADLKYGDEVPLDPKGKPYPAQSARAILQDLATNAKDKLIGPLAQRIADQLLDDVNVYFVPKRFMPKVGSGRAAGYYDKARHHILIDEDALNDNLSEMVRLHEISHALTVNKLDYGMANRDTIHGSLTTQLEAALEEARAALKKEGGTTDHFSNYFLSDIYEFTAGLYSGDTKFIEFLKRTKTGGETLLSKAVNIIRKLLGMEASETNLLTRVLGLTDQLIDERLDVSVRRPGASGPVVDVQTSPDFHAMAGVSADPETIKAVTDAGLNDVFGWSFGLEHKLRKVKELPGAKWLADKLIGTTVGYKGNGVVQRNAYDQALQLSDGWITTVKKTAYTQFEDYFKRSARKFWERGEVAKEWNEQLGNYVRGFPGEYDPTIIKTGDQIRKTLADVVDNINNPARATGGTKRGLTQDKYLDEAGNEFLTDPLSKNDNYLPRANDVHKWDQMVQQFGRDFVEKWWAGAFKSANPDVSDAVAERFGKWYVKRVEQGKKNGDQDFLSEQLRGLDKEALKESMLRSGLDEADAQGLLDNMFPVDRKGTGAVVSNTKQRSTIDETFSMDAMVDGERVSITMNNFINTDTLGILDGYFKRMGGAISLANHVDVYKQSDIGKAILDATKVDLGSTVPSSTLAKLRDDFQFTFDRILHRPIEEFSVMNKGMEMWRNFNVIRLMGAAVYNQIQELSQIVGTMGWKTTLQAIPELRGLMRDLKTGKVKNPLLDDLENMIGGAGSDLIMRADFNPSDDWVRELGNTRFNRWLDRGDNALRKMSSGTLKYTGMTGMMVQQKRIHAIAFVNHFFDVATKGKAMGLSAERLAWMGLGEADVEKVLDGMRRFAKQKDGVSGGKVGTVDFDAWKAEDPETLSKFVTAFQRESRRVVQENDLTSQIPIMGQGWAKTMFQFLNFVMQAWNKSLMFGMNHRDFETLSTVMHGALFASLVYMARTSAQMVGMSDEEAQEFADRRLSTEQIVANGFGRIAQASLLPNIIDQVSPVPIFSGMRTTSDTSDFLTSNPTLSSINTLFSMWRKGVRNTVSDDYQFTERDVRSYLRLAPLNNVIGVSGLLNSLASDLPRNEEVNPE